MDGEMSKEVVMWGGESLQMTHHIPTGLQDGALNNRLPGEKAAGAAPLTAAQERLRLSHATVSPS